MVGVPKDWTDDPSNGAGQAALDDVPLADPVTANGDMSIHVRRHAPTR